MRVVVGRVEPQAFRICPDDVCSIVLDQVHHALLKDLVRGLLRK